MVEVCGLTDHLLGECEVHDEFYKCPRCGEAVHSSNRNDHHDCPCKEHGNMLEATMYYYMMNLFSVRREQAMLSILPFTNHSK